MQKLQNSAKMVKLNSSQLLNKSSSLLKKNAIKVTNNEQSGFTKDIIPIKKFSHGLIITNDNRYVKILEILPVNFGDKDDFLKDQISDGFMSLFRSSIKKAQIKIISDKANPQGMIDHLNKLCAKETNIKIKERISDHIEYIKVLSKKGALLRRFFFIYEYSGDINGKKSTDINEIALSMYEDEIYLRKTFANIGNAVVHGDDRDYLSAEIIYTLLNRKTSIKESFNSRLVHLDHDRTLYNQTHSLHRTHDDVDCVAPKGLKFHRSDYCIVDGMYQTYLTLLSNTYPSRVYAGWLSRFYDADKVDMDIFIEKLNREFVIESMQQLTKFQDVKYLLNRNDRSKTKTNSENLTNNLDILNLVQSGQDLFNVAIVLTIRAKSVKELFFTRNQLIKNVSGIDIKFEEALINVKKYYSLTLPLLNTKSDILKRNYHNYLTEELGGLYCFTAYQLYDPKAPLFGVNVENDSLVSTNNFNTSLYANGNMLIIGKSGAGKTYSEQILGIRMRMQQTRVNYIIPKKGYNDYWTGCYQAGGSFITLAPNSKDCINIMAIRPEDRTDNQFNGDTNQQITSSLAKKSRSIITFTQLLMGKEEMTMDEESLLDVAIVRTYAKFGITEDNNSIFYPDGKIKTMPIISDLIVSVKEEPQLSRIVTVYRPFIDGTCKNMNGQTNVDTENYYTVYNVDDEIIPQKLFPAFMFIAFESVYSLAKSTRLVYDAIFLDEVWKMMINEASANQVRDMVKIIRGYAGCVILATQDIPDFLNSPGGFGKAVLSNTEIKMFHGLKKNELDEVIKVVDLSENDKAALLKFPTGRAILFANNEKVMVDICGSKMDDDSIVTNPNKVRELLERKIKAI